MRAFEIMSSPVLGLTPDAGIEEAAGLMLRHGFTSLPVVGAAGELAGVVTEADVVRARLVPGPRGQSTPEGGVTVGDVARTVRQVMRRPVPAVGPDAELTAVAELLLESRQRWVPVLGSGKLVGVISWRDLLRALVFQARA
ncbi:CBS domain-containing protein [Amycolatopsis acidicola]|uniref:CBS domain-containing protein n=1 Tax=Amycolatopsis acidicola TaxID=2596893 RepID=A0A5N0V185_9PSEU|nr:CBS domain-containing protein [Amycolatopsis acidicola]KAA9160217.1 CBS domain-containing protein [Amycolatopsis acidicola]